MTTERRSISRTSFEFAIACVLMALAAQVCLLISAVLLAWGVLPGYRHEIALVTKIISLLIWSGSFLLIVYIIIRYLLAQAEMLTGYDIDRDGGVGSIRGWSPGMLGAPYNPATGLVRSNDEILEQVVAQALIQADAEADAGSVHVFPGTDVIDGHAREVRAGDTTTRREVMANGSRG